MCKRLPDQHTRRRRALGRQAAQLLGQRHQRHPELVCLAENLTRWFGRCFGLRGSRTQHVCGEVTNDLDHHLLVLGRVEVEHSRTWRSGRTRRSIGRTHLVEGPVDRTRSTKTRLRAVVDSALGRAPDPPAVQDAQTCDPVEHRKADNPWR